MGKLIWELDFFFFSASCLENAEYIKDKMWF